jgi:hypothetical protein
LRCVAGDSLAERFQAISKYTGMQGPASYITFEYWQNHVTEVGKPKSWSLRLSMGGPSVMNINLKKGAGKIGKLSRVISYIITAHHHIVLYAIEELIFFAMRSSCRTDLPPQHHKHLVHVLVVSPNSVMSAAASGGSLSSANRTKAGQSIAKETLPMNRSVP